jgi:hypothetical protein
MRHIIKALRALPLEFFTKPHKRRHTGVGRYPENKY